MLLAGLCKARLSAAAPAAVLGALPLAAAAGQVEVSYAVSALAGASIYLTVQVILQAVAHAEPFPGKASATKTVASGMGFPGEVEEDEASLAASDAEEEALAASAEAKAAVATKMETEPQPGPRVRPPPQPPPQHAEEPPSSGASSAAAAAPERASPRRPRRVSPWHPSLASVTEARPGEAPPASGPGAEATGQRLGVGRVAAAPAFARPRSSAISAHCAGQPPALPEDCMTVVLWHLPRRCTPDELLECLRDRGFGQELELLYVPLDIGSSDGNVGFAILSLRTVTACQRIAADFHLARWAERLPGTATKKQCEVTPAPQQGLQQNLRQLRRNPAMAELHRRPEWLPRLFDAEGVSCDAGAALGEGCLEQTRQ
uniref:RRM domain-containing protein n=1 Tax=Alexandrium monilatum TaxID=311494 RepID=A0A7S4Q1Q7_9DINO|mmetsp:Transcript_45391/g.142383  ORF Transcript_45391/g.142383 Transcript_45391/m.142383 type:complete len:374 (-) Transcript_45391:106-1227(-)